MHVSASMCFPRVSQSSRVITYSCISGPHVHSRFEKTQILRYISADFALLRPAFGVKTDIRLGFWLERRK